MSKQSNHPPHVHKNIPKGINTRLSLLSANEGIFNQASVQYQEALIKSGYDYDLKFQPQTDNNNKRKRRRNILLYNSPYSEAVKTNLGKRFFAILDECFPKSSPLSKVFNRNTVKLSYSCTPSFKSYINRHNKRVMKKQQTPVNNCECRNAVCPVQGRCGESEIVYKAQVTRIDTTKLCTILGALNKNSGNDTISISRVSIIISTGMKQD